MILACCGSDGSVSWQEVGRVLGVAEAAESEREVVEAFAETKRAVWGRFWGS